ncbi:MAG TPA: methionyl-tRNA formyltransferase [Pyrinomonadaceae bacterium]|nr:methionyl-tRNA formyltransferase [Pyrinomonadaceae bacterium]
MRIVFMGTPQAAAIALERLIGDGHDIAAVYTQPDRPAGRGNKIAFSPVKRIAVAAGLPIFQPIKVKTPEAVEMFTSHAADVVVVVAYGRILPDAFLNAFPKGAINVHFSLLPKYRGAAPVNWAIVNGERETGVTTMQMDEGLDTGAILLQRNTAIGTEETAIELMTRLSDLAAWLISDTLQRLDEISPTAQEDDLATYAPIMKRDDGLVDWRRSAWDIEQRIRGFQPFPTTFTYAGGVKLTLWAAVPTQQRSERPVPGRIISARGDNLIVACGDGSELKIHELQPEGKRRMAVRDFLNGFVLKEGDVLGA